MEREAIRYKVQTLRARGKTYSEIRKAFQQVIPKSTISYWCKEIVVPKEYLDRVKKINKLNIQKAQILARVANKKKREEYFISLYNRNKHIGNLLENLDVCKIILTVLYLGEGSKATKGALMFGNSDPLIIRLFFQLLGVCYEIDKSKFRCTLQCRADQDIERLELFWSELTQVPLSQFYKARVDKRTIGKPSRKKDYKGVCRVDYFSADIYNELKVISEIMYSGLFGPVV